MDPTVVNRSSVVREEGKASDYVAGPAEQQIINKIIGDVSECRQNRQVNEKQWLINIAMLHGKQHFEIERVPNAGLDSRIMWELKEIARKRKTLRTSNYILPIFRSLLARLLMMKSTVSIEPTTNSQRDKSAARVSNEAAEDFWDNCNKRNPILCQDEGGMLLVLKKLFTYMLCMGQGYLKPYFNPKTVSKFYLNNEIGEGEIGEVEVKVRHAFDVFKDPMRMWSIEQSIYHVDEVEAMYGYKCEPEDVGFSETEQRLISLIEGTATSKWENAARIYEKYCLAGGKHPNGKMYVCNRKKILYDGELPAAYKGRLPHFDFKYIDFFMSLYGQALIEQLISLQEDYNETLSKIAGYKKWMAGKLLIPRGANISEKWNDQIGQIVFYDPAQKPSYEQAPPAPEFLFKELMRIRKDMEDVSGVHDASLGRVPQQAKSGRAIENLTELDNSQMAPNLLSIEAQLSFFMDTVINIMTEHYSEPRFLSITGDQVGPDIKNFIGSSLMGNRRTRVSLGSAMPISKEARQEFIFKLLQLQIIDQEKARELLEFGDIDGVYHNLDETLAREENQNMLEPRYEVIAEQWEDHNVHIKVHTDFMKTKEFFELDPLLQEKIKLHREQHQEYLRMEIAAIPGGQAPAAAAPAGAKR